MTKFIEKVPALSALLLVSISIILVVLMYVGGNASSIDVAGDALTVPKFTDTLLYWTYFLLGLAICITLFMALLGYVKTFISSPKTALNTLIPLVLFVLLFIVAWSLSTGERMSIIGYEGTENEGFWARFSEMVIYSIYALFAAIGITIIGARIYTSSK